LKEGFDKSIVGFETTFKQESVRLTIWVENLLNLFKSLIFIILISQFGILISYPNLNPLSKLRKIMTQ